MAYDLETDEFLVGDFGRAHTWAYKTLLDRATRRHLGAEAEEAEEAAKRLVVKGYMATIAGYEVPLVMTLSRYIGDPSPRAADHRLLAGEAVLPLRLAMARADRLERNLRRRRHPTEPT